MQTIELINDTYNELRQEMGPVYKSKMEGYGVLVSRLNMVQDYMKETRKAIATFGEIVQHTAPEAQKEALMTIMADASRLTAEAAVMAASVWELMLKWDNDSPVTFKADGHTVHDFDARFAAEDAGLIDPSERFRWEMIGRKIVKPRVELPGQMRMEELLDEDLGGL